MELLIVPVPLFDKDMAVEAYYFRYQKGNDYVTTALQSTAVFDGATFSPPLETLNMVGIEAFTVDQPIIVPVSSVALLGDLSAQCSQPPERIIFLLNSDAKPEEPYLSNMKALREKGYRFAFHDVYDLEQYKPLLELSDFIYINIKHVDKFRLEELLSKLGRNFRNLKVVATHVDTLEELESLKRKRIDLFEGRYYRVPVTRGQSEVSPLKTNLIRLLNIVRDENFEFDMVADIVQKDTALSLSLMRLVNSPFLGLSQRINTINHAVTILGQNEVRKWVTTSVSRSLGADRPNEVTRLSLVRAKFAENLAEMFHLERESQSLFLMGLFSVLDIILEVKMEDALKLVLVSDDIHQALVERSGPFAAILKFVESYEIADWSEISRQLIILDQEVPAVYDAYIEAVSWYTDLIGVDVTAEA